jgi:hypothetical protein
MEFAMILLALTMPFSCFSLAGESIGFGTSSLMNIARYFSSRMSEIPYF